MNIQLRNLITNSIQDYLFIFKIQINLFERMDWNPLILKLWNINL